tara:strand:+ start:1201 stop:1677 length:477 start_codon:yes stop_codon:yes gene_type:complete
LVDSLDIDTSKGPLGELYLGDTLILFARYSECGEFGGHKEWLKIFSDDSALKCKVIYDSVNCDSPTETMTFARLENSIFQMTKTAQSATVNYLNELTQMRFLRQEPDFHVGNLYSAVVRSSMDWEQDTTYEVWWWDQSLKWTEFQKLKNEIKTTANKK